MDIKSILIKKKDINSIISGISVTLLIKIVCAQYLRCFSEWSTFKITLRVTCCSIARIVVYAVSWLELHYLFEFHCYARSMNSIQSTETDRCWKAARVRPSDDPCLMQSRIELWCFVLRRTPSLPPPSSGAQSPRNASRSRGQNRFKKKRARTRRASEICVSALRHVTRSLTHSTWLNAVSAVSMNAYGTLDLTHLATKRLDRGRYISGSN